MSAEQKILIVPYKTRDGMLHTVSLLVCDHTEAYETYKCVSFQEDVDADMYTESVNALLRLGYRVDDPDRWNYMGGKTYGDEIVYGYAVDITGVDKIDPEEKDEEPKEEAQLEFALEDVAITDALNDGDGYCCSALVQLFKYVFNIKDYDKLLKKGKAGYGQGDGAAEQTVDAARQVDGEDQTLA